MPFTAMKKFKSVSKSRTMKRMTGFDGRVGRSDIEPLPVFRDEKVKVVTDREKEIAQALHDDELAKRVVKLLEKHPYATVIEMLAMDWLDKNLAEYVYQAQVNGGYRAQGAVPDFVLKDGNSEWIALLINGNYWHDVNNGHQNDVTDKLALTGSYYQGRIIAAVVIIWESRLMRSKQARDEAMLAATQRVELGI